MVKRLMLLGIVGFLFMSFANANETPQTPKKEAVTAYYSVPTADTSIKGEAAQQNGQLSDPKKVFQDLDQSMDLDTKSPITPQLNPRIVSYVESYADRYTDLLNQITDRGRPYLRIIEEVLVKHGLPKELKYLAIIESDLKSNSRSKVGAVGPWQLMPQTARDLGLKVNKYVDERKDFRKSTRAAALYLNDLYALYGDWLLTIAAYNCGPGNVNKAIRNAGSRNFWKLQYYLPTESRNHVKRYIATHYIIEGEAGLTTLTKQEMAEYLLAASAPAPSVETPQVENTAAAIVPVVDLNKVLIISGKYNAIVISKYVTMDIGDFNRLNPDFDRVIADRGHYEMRLPEDKMSLFLENKHNILNESIQVLLNSVQDTEADPKTAPVTAKADK